MKKTKFIPEKHAFRFVNDFKNKVITPKGIKNFETSGLCGGMSFAALDYFFAGLEIPASSRGLEPYLIKRQIDSFKYKDSWRFARWTRRSTRNIMERTEKNEIPKIRKSIDEGKPVVLGLIRATRIRDIGDDNHQVVCIGYNELTSGDTELYIYDPNHPPGSHRYPSGEVVLSKKVTPVINNPDIGKEIPGDPTEPIKTITRAGHPFKTKYAGTWRGFFMMRYEPESNPPRRGSSDSVRDHRDRKERDHRNKNSSGGSGPVVRDHRKTPRKTNSGPVVRDHRKREKN